MTPPTSDNTGQQDRTHNSAAPKRPLRSELPVLDGTTLTALAEVCACGSQCLACPDCGGIRCLHCDPLEVSPERKAECCDD